MNILITGACGFVGRNLAETLLNIRDGKDRTHPEFTVDELFLYDIDSTQEELEEACSCTDFVFNLAGVNRPKDAGEFMTGNFGFASTLLECLKSHHNTCPVMLSSSTQATLAGRFKDSEYGRSKLAGEELFFNYAKETGAKVLVYRFPNLFGKWCRPNYNSAVATFCHNIAHDLPIQVNDRLTEIELLYIDDLVREMLMALTGWEHRCSWDGAELIPTPGCRQITTHEGTDGRALELGRYCYVPTTHHVTLGEIVDTLEEFRRQPATLMIPELKDGSFTKKLYSTYLSYLPKDKICFDLASHEDARGSFTELLRTVSGGQFSVNVSKPGITKGNHWHHSKWEFFIVVSGRALIRERALDSDEVIEFTVDGAKPQAVHMLPGYTHSIENLSDTEDLVTLMWANEVFDPTRSDTYHEEV